MQKLVSVIVPVYNEEQSIVVMHEQLAAVTDPLPYAFEFLFVNDGSTDHSGEKLSALEASDRRSRIIDFSRNFGKEIAVTAGLQASRGDAAIILDADLQHPISLIPEFITKWESGAEVVVGVRKRYGHESVFKRLSSWLFYALLSHMSDTPIKPRATDYRLLDRVVVNAFNRFTERNRLTRGLIDWLGFRPDYVYFTSADRLYGRATYAYNKLFGLAMHSFVSMSLFPLKIAGRLGLVITVLSGITGVFMFIEKYVLHDPLGLNFSGPAMLAVLNMFWIGIVLTSLGLIALYIAHIHAEVINRPLYVTRERVNQVRPPGKNVKTQKH